MAGDANAGVSQNSYRGLVRMAPGAKNARNYSQCDSLLIGSRYGAAHCMTQVLNPGK